MKEVIVRNVTLGSGIPKICVPLTGKTKENLLAQATAAVKAQPDLIEWRADFYDQLTDAQAVKTMAQDLRQVMEEIPLLFTVRTDEEGGAFPGTIEEYMEILKQAAASAAVDLVDVELYRDTARMKNLMADLQQMGKVVIASNHHFDKTPSQDQMEDILDDMESAGADIRKLAVMPQFEEDVLSLLSATREAANSGEAPVITMSMGQLGVISRISGTLTGSCMTFGTVGEASAPGQLDIHTLRGMLEKLG